MKSTRLIAIALLMIAPGSVVPAGAAPVGGLPSLKEAANGFFLIGAAINTAHINETDKAGVAIVDTHFDSITPENVMKWEVIHPELNRYDFEHADKFVEFGSQRAGWSSSATR